MLVSLEDLTAQAIGDPGSIVGKKLGPSWPRRHAAYSPTEETVPRWATRAVLTALDNRGALVPTDGRLITFRAGNDDRPTTMTIHVDGPTDIFRLLINMISWQVDFGSAARSALVQMRDEMTPEHFDPLAKMMLGGQYEKLRERFLRDFDCAGGCGRTIQVGQRFYPTKDAEAICYQCGRGWPEYRNNMVTRQAEPELEPATEPANA